MEMGTFQIFCNFWNLISNPTCCSRRSLEALTLVFSDHCPLTRVQLSRLGWYCGCESLSTIHIFYLLSHDDSMTQCVSQCIFSSTALIRFSSDQVCWNFSRLRYCRNGGMEWKLRSICLILRNCWDRNSRTLRAEFWSVFGKWNFVEIQ